MTQMNPKEIMLNEKKTNLKRIHMTYFMFITITTMKEHNCRDGEQISGC